MNYEEVELDWFVGKTFTLSAVGTYNLENEGIWDNEHDVHGSMEFVLNDVLYSVATDEDDGYRSYLGGVRSLKEFTPLRNTFVMPCEVVCVKLDSKNDIIKFMDTTTNLPVLGIGTDYSDNWYPYAISDFTPEHMLLNRVQYGLEV